MKPHLDSIEEFGVGTRGYPPRNTTEYGLANVRIILTIPEDDAIMFALSGTDIEKDYERALVNFVEDRWGHRLLPRK